jgi:hypothetical protein
VGQLSCVLYRYQAQWGERISSRRSALFPIMMSSLLSDVTDKLRFSFSRSQNVDMPVRPSVSIYEIVTRSTDFYKIWQKEISFVNTIKFWIKQHPTQLAAHIPSLTH